MEYWRDYKDCWETWLDGLDWVITGGETGPRARPMHPDWVRLLRDQCISKDTPFFFKSWGEWCHPDQMSGKFERMFRMYSFGSRGSRFLESDADIVAQCGKKRAGRLLDGRAWDEMPEVNDYD